jgi:single-strand DNA-binding protein
MSTINKVILIGNLGKDPQTKVFDNGNKLCNFSIATTENWTDKNTGEKKSKTDWHNISVGGKLADICDRFLKKGSKVYVEGKLSYREYEKNGEKRIFTEIKASSITFMGGNNNDNSSNYSAPEPTNEPDDLPF